VKTEATTARLLQGRVVKGKRPVCSTSVVEELQRLSLQAFAAASRPTAPDSQEHEDLGVDEIVAKKKHKSTAEMKLLNIPGPAYGDTCPAAELHAASNGSRQLWLELTPSTIEYLQLAVEAQLSMLGPEPGADTYFKNNGRGVFLPEMKKLHILHSQRHGLSLAYAIAHASLCVLGGLPSLGS